MIYDRDLRHARWSVFGLIAANIITVIVNVSLREWNVALAAGVWTLCCCLWVRIIAAQQITRDMGRVIEAGLHGMRREIETGEL